MTTMFNSVDEAKGEIASRFKISPEDFKEASDLRAIGMDVALLDDPDTAEEVKQSIRERVNAQKGFRAEIGGRIIQIVIGPFRDGFDCWIVGANNMCMRI